jgi:hypothetical protein
MPWSFRLPAFDRSAALVGLPDVLDLADYCTITKAGLQELFRACSNSEY